MIEFGPFRYDPEARLLYHGDNEMVLPMRVVAVLESFLKRPGKIVQKEDILASAWGGAFVGEDSLTQAVSQLRSALGDDPRTPTYIQTIPKRGYRFVAEVSETLRSTSPVPQPTEEDDQAEVAPERAEGGAGPPPTFAPGATVGHYELTARIGAGAMGEVWRARDRELQRDVAIKVVPDELAGETAVIERLRREARMLAALNHPNIATIHGVGQANGAHFIVMELLEGDTLQERLTRAAPPIDEALEIAVQVTRALQAAHRAGIVHRDLKPGNIMLAAGGQVKVLDFGLAKDAGAGDAAVSADPTTLTVTGLPIGTAAYMSPEQAAAKPIDARSDVFSFGCVLFEMLAGRRPFGGTTASEIVAGILKDEPQWEKLPSTVPRPVQRVLRRCLEKDPDRRVHDIADARIEIQDAISAASGPDIDESTKTGDSPARVLDRSRRSLATTWGATLLVVAAAAFVLGRSSLPEPEAPPASDLIRHPVSLPSNTELDGQSFAISPDGSTLVYAARRRGVEPVLYRHPLDELEGIQIPGTDGASRPFFSPDGLWVAFVKQEGLWRVLLTGGSPLFICAVPGGRLRGAQWLRDGTIIFAGTGSAILEVPEQGGEPRALTDAEEPEYFGHRLPWVLPGERGLLFYAWPGDPQTGGHLTAHLDRQTEQIQEVLPGAVDARYMPTGHLIWGDPESSSTLAASFDLDSLTIQGTPIPVPEIDGWNDSGSAYHVSGNGTLVYRPRNPDTGSLVLVDPTGNEDQVDGFENIWSVRASPATDRRLLAAVQYQSGVASIWIVDLDRPESPRLLRRGDVDGPVFSADGRSVFYSDWTEPASGSVYRIAIDGTGEPTPLITVGFYPQVVSVHPDGETLLYQDQDGFGNWMVHVARIEDLEESVGQDPRNGVAEPLVSGVSVVNKATFSPDGNWVAYTSWETGEAEVYIRPFEGGRARGRSERVSTNGGTDPVWHPDGKELFYRSGRQQFSVSFTDDDGTPRLAAPTLLFDRIYMTGFGDYRRDDVLHDGTFVKLRPEDGWTIELPDLVVVHNWFEELKRLVPTDGSR